MAITFTKTRSETNYLDGFNNNIVEFSSDEGVLEHIKCTINIGGVDFVITPSPSNLFRFNFLEAVRSLISGKFEDSMSMDDVGDINDTNLIWTYLVTFTITFSDDSTEQTTKTFNFLRSVSQIGQQDRVISEGHLMSEDNLIVFSGYPFDFAFLNDGNVFSIINKTTGKRIDFDSTFDDTRIVTHNGNIGLSEFAIRVQDDGGTFESNCHGDVVDILQAGFNTICLQGDVIKDKELTIEVKDVCGGLYLKWLNRKGSWSYWLFERVYTEDTGAKSVDKYVDDFENLEDAVGSQRITGKDTDKTGKVRQTVVSINAFNQLKDILSSPNVQLWNGTQNGGVGTWQGVILKDGKWMTKNTKTNLVNLEFTVELTDYNQN